ncbi:MAG: hypothetical protein J0H04_05785, partial [Hyphomicrobium denitrificans]|nr:hypothetical protein [Hyphomicrobium denitrificans]
TVTTGAGGAAAVCAFDFSSPHPDRPKATSSVDVAMMADLVNSLNLRLSDFAGGCIIAGAPDAFFVDGAPYASPHRVKSRRPRAALPKKQMTRNCES